MVCNLQKLHIHDNEWIFIEFFFLNFWQQGKSASVYDFFGVKHQIDIEKQLLTAVTPDFSPPDAVDHLVSNKQGNPVYSGLWKRNFNTKGFLSVDGEVQGGG